MKKILLPLLITLSLMASCAPSQVVPGALPSPSVEEATNGEIEPIVNPSLRTSLIPPEETPDYDENAGSVDVDYEFGVYYVENVDDLYILSLIVGIEQANNYFNFVSENMRNESFKKHIEKLWLWEGIQYFGITKEEFIMANEETKELNAMVDGYQTTYTDEQIDALFNEDTEARIIALLNPNALYRDGRFYNIYDLMGMTADELEETGYTPGELLEFSERIQQEMSKYVDGDGTQYMIEYYMPLFEQLENNTASMSP